MRYINQKIDAPPRLKRQCLIGARFLDARSVPHTKVCGFQTLRHQLSLLYPFAPRVANELHQDLFKSPVSVWPIHSFEMEFPEEHDQIEHKHIGKKYIDFLIGALKKSASIVKGRGIYDESKAEAVFPSNYSLELLKREGSLSRVVGNCVLRVEGGIRTSYIRQEGINF